MKQMKATLFTVIGMALCLPSLAQNEPASTSSTAADKYADLPVNTISADAGYGWLSTKIVLYDNNPFLTSKHAGGFDYRLAYDHKVGRQFAVGLAFSEWQSYLDKVHDEWSIHLRYIGPYFQARYPFTRKLHGIARYGIGAGFVTTDFSKDKSAFALESGLGLEYRMAKHFGLAVNFNTTVIFAKSEGKDPDNEENSIRRNTLTGGLRYYF